MSKPKTLCLRLLLVALFLGLSVQVALALSADSGADHSISTSDAKQSAPATNLEEQEHGLSQGAVEIGRVFGFPVSNSMIGNWIVAFSLIILARVATRRMDNV